MKLNYHKRGVTYEQIMKLVDAAIDFPESDEKHSQACAAVLSMEWERNLYRAALEKIISNSFTLEFAQHVAREALSTTTTGERT